MRASIVCIEIASCGCYDKCIVNLARTRPPTMICRHTMAMWSTFPVYLGTRACFQIVQRRTYVVNGIALLNDCSLDTCQIKLKR